jgi:hypothetical protein
MKSSILYAFAFLLIVISCNSIAENESDAFQRKLKKFKSHHLEPSSEKVNELKLGQTIIFESAERSGIDRGRFPAPSYYNDIDNAFFQFVKTERFDDGAAGGYSYEFEIYKAIATGNTKITYHKVTTSQHERTPNDTTVSQRKDEIIDTYEMIIK